MIYPSEIASAFRARERNSSKYSVGTVTIVGGSNHYNHAPVIAGIGARSAGGGLVQLVVPDASRICAGALLPEATFTKLTPTCVPPRADVTVMGMGLSTSLNAQAVVSRVLSGSSGRFVLDADALTILAGWYAAGQSSSLPLQQQLVMTPHEGEAARLLSCRREEIAADREAACRELVARYRATVVLKGAGTLVMSSDGQRLWQNTSGNPFLALAGAGDLLAGMIGARWAYTKGDPFLATCAAVWMHGAAADQLVADREDMTLVNLARQVGRMRISFDQ